MTSGRVWRGVVVQQLESMRQKQQLDGMMTNQLATTLAAVQETIKQRVLTAAVDADGTNQRISQLQVHRERKSARGNEPRDRERRGEAHT